MKSQLLVFVLILACFQAKAQGFQTVFPGLSGQELIDSVASHFRPAHVLDYANARDTLYAKVLAINDDSLRCIYSGHTLYLDPTQDPTQYVYQNGGTNGMNTEHAYPQAKGATQGTNAYSDMHHLYPTRIALNEARGDKPFLDIPDNQTQKWFMNNQSTTSIPPQNIDLYAESSAGAFEPRESSKGDVARSVFYFYTVYRNQANAADPAFFDIQRATLCLWNALDPATLPELEKTWRIAPYQDGKPNPFVLDCTLANRTWCPEVSPVCFSASGEPAQQLALNARIFPMPAAGNAVLALELPVGGNLTGRVYSAIGQEISAFKMENVPPGPLSIPLDFKHQGIEGLVTAFVEICLQTESGKLVKTLPILLIN